MHREEADLLMAIYSLTKDSGITVQQLKTQTYSKPTDIHKYIPPSSCTPNLSVRSPAIIKGVAHRLRMTNTEDGDLLTALNNYSGYIEASGYDRKAIMKHFHSIMDTSNQALVSTVKVQDSSFKCPLVVKMHPALPDIRDVMRKFLPTLSRCPLASKVFPGGSIFLAYRKLPPLSTNLLMTPFSPSIPMGAPVKSAKMLTFALVTPPHVFQAGVSLLTSI